jgi:hypothetical protein
MLHVKKESAKMFINSPSCTVYEYEIKDKDINIAVAKISGRYPSIGWALNERCKMIGFVLNGSGFLAMADRKVALSENDMVLILPKEKYYWDGNMTILMPSTPAWYLDQYKQITP